MQTLQNLITRRKLTMTAKQVSDNPHMEIKAGMSHWRCKISNEAGHKMTIIFSMGSAHNGRQPELAEVLDCLASDAASVDNARSFEDWASEMGCDTDSRKAYRTYEICQKQADELRCLMGADYQGLLFETERL